VAEKKSILLIDDHPLFREGLKSIIGRDGRFNVVGEAENGRHALKMVRNLKPDLIVVDISLPDVNGIQLTREIRKIFSEAKILIVSMHSKIDYIAEAFQVGAMGYVVKESATEGLLQALRSVAKGEYYLDSSVSPQVIRNLMKLPVKEARITDSDYGSLTVREQEVMRMLAEGVPSKEIADKLFISPKTVENHRANIMKKLNLTAQWIWFGMPSNSV